MAIDPGELHCRRIGDADEWPVHPPTPRHADVNRIIRRNRIQILARWKAAFLQLVGPADIAQLGRSHRHKDDPFVLRCPRDGVRDRVGDGGDRMPPGERITAARFEPLAVHMGVGIEKPRAGRPSIKVDHPAGPSPVRKQLGGTSNRAYQPAGHRHGVGNPRAAVQRDDRTVMENKIVLGHDSAFWQFKVFQRGQTV